MYRIGKKSVVVGSLLATLLLSYTFDTNRRIVRKTYTLKQNKLQGKMKILFMSDIHYGCCYNKQLINRKLRRLEHEQFDLVILGGDIVQYPMTTKTDMIDIIRRVGKIPSKYGTYFVYGNHDYCSDGAIFDNCKHNDYYTKFDLVDELIRNGITILDDESIELDNGVILIGRRAYSEGQREHIEDMVSYDDSYTICVDHYPVDMPNCSTSGVDLQLSGHTHGGQVFPINLFLPLIWKFPAYGLHKYADMNLIISSGMSIGAHAFRTVHRCEYVIINIV